MRPRVIQLAVAAGLLLAAPAAAGSGGGAVAPATPTGKTGGAGLGMRFPETRPRLVLFATSGSRLPTVVRFRVTAPIPVHGARIEVLGAAGRSVLRTIRLGTRRAGVLHRARVAVKGLAPGSYRLRIAAPRMRSARGVRATTSVAVSAPAPAPVPAPPPGGLSHVFPLGGPYTFGGPDARFGTPRSGHTHQGQDLVAAEGTPVRTPHAGLVKAVGYQASGAGHYVVVDGAGEQRDYVFMHLRTGSVTVTEGQALRTGQGVGQVGSTGRSSGPHLHFEIWDGKGWYTGGEPIDPLPLLQAWAT